MLSMNDYRERLLLTVFVFNKTMNMLERGEIEPSCRFEDVWKMDFFCKAISRNSYGCAIEIAREAFRDATEIFRSELEV